jgi:phosphoserine phosphatase
VLAAQAGVALQRARLIGHFLQKQEMERAMKIAREIQQELLPEPRPRICGYDVAGFCQPADQTGGDTYDFMPLPDGRWMLAVADATGHGIGPALVIAETRAMLRALSRHGRPDATAVLRNVNELLAVDLGDARFVTCFLGLLDPLVHRLSFASAGHGPLLFYRRATDAFEEVNATGLPLGVLAGAPFDEVLTRGLERGDFAAVTTDGFFEAANPSGALFGVQRMLDLLRRDRDLPSERMIANLHAAVVDFTAGRPAQDDLTAVIVRRR